MTQKKTLKHYWYRAAGVAPNFGDELGNEILKKMGYETQWAPAEEADIITTGTVLSHLKRKFKDGVQIWGTGASFSSDPLPREFAQKLDILALRGELTERWLGIEEGTSVLGDPGYLAPLFYEEQEKEYDYGFVRQEFDQARHDNLPRGTHLIYATGMPEQVINEITKCRFIFSSSMHGLIVAQAYGIPCQYIPSTRPRLNDKYFDYNTASPMSADHLKDIQDGLLNAAKRIGKPRPKNAKKVQWVDLDAKAENMKKERHQEAPIFVTFYYDQEGSYYKDSALRNHQVLISKGAVELVYGDDIEEDNKGKNHSLVINLHEQLTELTEKFGQEYGGITKLKPFIIDAVRRKYNRPIFWWDCDGTIIGLPKLNDKTNHRIKFAPRKDMVVSDLAHYWPMTQAADDMLNAWMKFLDAAQFGCGDHTGLRVVSADHNYDLVKMGWIKDGSSRTDSKTKDMQSFRHAWKEKGYKYNG